MLQTAISAGTDYRHIFDEFAELRAEVLAAGKVKFEAWRNHIERPEFEDSARNLADYLALRSRDLRPLQHQLMRIGLSSLGRLEARVRPNLNAVTTCLAALSKSEIPAGCHMPPDGEFFHGDQILAANAESIFGPQKTGRTRILPTLDREAADDPEFVLRLATGGADAVRINCAHDGENDWRGMIENLRAAERRLGRRIPVLMDIAGPKLRISNVSSEHAHPAVHIGDEILLCRALPGSPRHGVTAVTCEPESVLDHLQTGDAVSVDDGKLRGAITGASGDGFTVRFEHGRLKGVKLRPGKGINFPGVEIPVSRITPKDQRDLDFICSFADMVGFSFVESAQDVAQLQRELAARRADWRKLVLVAKIETPRAVRNLPEIIVQAAGQQPLSVMIARGDLAVEMGFSRVAEMQEEILWICEAAHIPSIWATQVLEGLVTRGLPSRGEMTDAAMAARAECVMLNKGPNLLEAIGMLDKLLQRMAQNQVKKTPTLRILHSWSDPR